MSHIFVSYSRIDLAFAQKIVTALAENNLDTWIDWKSIPKGEDWEQEIYRGIEEADAFLFLISPDSVASEICNREIAHAINNGKRILPIFIANTDDRGIYEVTERFPYEEQKREITRRNFIKCRDGRDDFDRAIGEIQTTIQTDFEWLKYHTRLQVKALEWEKSRDAGRLLRGKELREAEEQFAGGESKKDPLPTDLHRSYLLTSQRNELRQRRLLIIGLGFGLTVVAILAVFAWGQRNSALASESTAIAEGNNRATAQALAEERANLALARLLAVEATRLISGVSDADSGQIRALLAIESLNHFPTLEGNQALRSFGDFWNREVFSTGDYLESAALSPDGKWFVYLHEVGLSIRDTTTWQETLTIPLEDTSGWVSFSPDSQWVTARFYSGDSTRIWNITSGKPLDALPVTNGPVTFSPDGTLIFQGQETGMLNIWKTNTGELIGNVPVFADGEFITSLDNRLVAASGDKNMISIWDIPAFSQQASLVHGGVVDELEFTPDGSRLVTHSTFIGSLTGEHTIWDTAAWKKIASKGDNFENLIAGPLDNFTLSPDGKILASILSGNEILLWKVDQGIEMMHLQHELGSVLRFLSFDPSGQFLFAGDFVGIITVWDVLTGIEIARVAQAVDAVSLASDGKWVISVDRFEGKVIEWLWRTEDLVESACLSLIKRNLYEWEWAHYLSGEEYQPTCPDKAARPVPTSTLDGYFTAIAPFSSTNVPSFLTPSP